MKVITIEGDEVSVSVNSDVVVGEVVQSTDGDMYEVTTITEEAVIVGLIEIEEDWGE